MSNLFLIGIYVLILANALVCGGVVFFLIVFLKRQKEGFRYIIERINQLEKKTTVKKQMPKQHICLYLLMNRYLSMKK